MAQTEDFIGRWLAEDGMSNWQYQRHCLLPGRDYRSGKTKILRCTFWPCVGPSRDIGLFDRLEELLAARQPRIIYLENEPDSRISWQLGRWAKKNNGLLVCVTNENDLPSPVPAFFRGDFKSALRSVRSRVWSLATRAGVAHVFAICTDGVDTMAAIGFGGKVSLMPLGFDTDLFFPLEPARREEIREKLGLLGPVVAYFGRLAPNKGVLKGIEALGQIMDLPWQFLLDDFAGNQSAYAGQLKEALNATSVGERTVLFQSSHDEMPQYMNAADIVIVPSIWKEQYGRVAPEAMACGCAVVVSDIGALPELVGNTGLKVPAGNVKALASAIRGLIQSPDRRELLGSKAAERASVSLSITAQADIVSSVLHRLLGRTSSDQKTP